MNALAILTEAMRQALELDPDSYLDQGIDPYKVVPSLLVELVIERYDCEELREELVLAAQGVARTFEAGLVHVGRGVVEQVAQIPGRSYQDLVDAHMLFREQCGTSPAVYPARDFFYQGRRIGMEVRVKIQPKRGDRIDYADAYYLHSFEVP